MVKHKVAIAQLVCRPGNIEANVDRIEKAVDEAVRRDAEVVVVPEIADTGYTAEAIANSASSHPEGVIDRISAIASVNNVWLVCGLTEHANGTHYNTLAVIDSNGQVIARYRKVHLFRYGAFDEGKFFSAGERLVACSVAGMASGLLLCYDLRFPEAARCLVLGGACVLIVSAAWPAERIEAWRVLVRARAIENQCYVIAANRAGIDGGLRFGGMSAVVGPSGEVLSEAGAQTEELIEAVVDLDEVAAVRKRIPALNDRQPRVYSRWV